ncbi:flavin reductase family protein [bacterium]
MDLKILTKLSYGIYVVCSKHKEIYNGQIANVVFQTSAEPPTITVSINKQNLTYELIENSKVFTVSILSQDTPMIFIGRFGFQGGRNIDKIKDIQSKIGITGAPVVLENGIGYLEAEVINTMDVFTHTLFLGKIVNAEIIREAQPMTYDYYHTVLKAKSPKTAPTYMKE